MVMALNSLRNQLRVMEIPALEKFLNSKLGFGINIIDDEMRIIWTNSTFTKWFGGRSKLHGDCSNLHRTLAPSCLDCPAVLTFKTGKVQFREQAAITAWGEKRLYRFTTVPLRDKMGVVIRIMELIEDVTKAPATELDLEISKNAEVNSLLAIFCLDQEGNIVSTNPDHLRISKAPPEKVIGMNWLQVPKSKELGLSEHLVRGLKGEAFELQNFRYLTYRGDKEIYIDLKGVPLHRTDGKIEGLLCIMKERTDAIGGVIDKCPIIGKSKAINEVKKLIERVNPHTCPILIEGESGTGKELVAQEIHRKSRRAVNPFVAVNGAAFQDTLLESELFGHSKGAFTGAEHNKKGLLELAHNGTFFLDEVGEISPAMQVKLLRVLETGTFRPLGDVKEVKVNVRFVAATNRNLADEVKKGNFREDLYYRLNVVRILLPPLRERVEDIPLLVNHFLSQEEKDRPKTKHFNQEALKCLAKYHWPGNIRELANVVERALIMAQDEEVQVEDLLQPGMGMSWNLEERVVQAPGDERPQTLVEFLEEAEKNFIIQMMTKTGKNKEQAAELLNISVRSLYRKMTKYDIAD